MKMRFWQKTYLFTLALFLLCLNMGILSLTVYTYRENVEATETAVKAEQYYIAMGFERDYAALMEEDGANPSLLIQSFGTYYDGKGLYIAFEEDGILRYSNFDREYTVGTDQVQHTRLDGKRHILIASRLCDGKYLFVLGKDASSLDSEFWSLMLVYAVTAGVVSLILAGCLYFVLKKLSAPLEKLRKTTQTVEAGDYTVTAEELGNDEFTLLAKSFNAMLTKINEQMKALELDAEKKQMLVDNLAHELRTPLTGIYGYGEFLEKAAASEEQRILAARYIMSEAQRLQKISETLLDSAYIRENTPGMHPVDAAAVLADTSQRLAQRAARAGVSLTCAGEALTVQGDETLLSMLFYNLTENAIKACGPGGQVRLCCENGTVTVTDNGKGMIPEQLLHITEPFYRTDKSRSRAEGGAGLGLALCAQIARAHGAQLRFESEVEKGTRVTVSFTSLQ